MNYEPRRLLLTLIATASISFSAQGRINQSGSQDVGTYRWQDGCSQDGKVCGSYSISDGLALLSLTVHGVSVDVVLVDTGRLTVVAAAVGNGTGEPVPVVPQLFTLYDMGQKPRKMQLIEPESKAKAKDKWSADDSAWAKRAEALVTSRIRSEGRLSAAPAGGPGGPSRGEVTRDGEMAREFLLRADNVPPQKFMKGMVLFESNKGADQLLLSVPVAGYVFEFPFVRKKAD